MPAPVVGLALGAGALWLMGQLRGDKPTGGQQQQSGAPPATGGATPNAVPGGLSSDAKWAVGLGISSIPTVIGIGAAIAKAAGVGAAAASGAASGGGAAGAGAGAGAAEGAAGGISLSTVTSGIISEAIGGSVILIGIVAILVSNMIVDAVAGYAAAAAAFVNSTFAPAANWFFNGFIAKATSIATQSGGKINIALPSATIRKLALTSIYLQYVGDKARNDALMRFYDSTGTPIGNRPMFSPTGITIVGGQFGQQVVGDYWSEYFASRHAHDPALLVSNLNCLAPGCNWQLITAPILDPSEMQSAALEILGDKYQHAVDWLAFQGAASAITLGTQVIYTRGYYPGDLQFVTELGQSMLPGWTVETSNYWTTNKALQFAVWLVDPVTGNRVAPAEIRRQWKMIVSIKGMEIAPGVLAGFSGRRLSGRRLGRFGRGVTSSQCTENGQFVPCPAVDGPSAQRFVTGTRVGPALGGAGLPLLPLLGLGAGALYLLLGRRRGG